MACFCWSFFGYCCHTACADANAELPSMLLCSVTKPFGCAVSLQILIAEPFHTRITLSLYPEHKRYKLFQLLCSTILLHIIIRCCHYCKRLLLYDAPFVRFSCIITSHQTVCVCLNELALMSVREFVSVIMFCTLRLFGSNVITV